MMRASHVFNLVRCLCVGTQRLDVVVLLFGKFVTGNVELQSAAERDVEQLKTFADSENRQNARKCRTNSSKFQVIAKRIDIILEYCSCRDRLPIRYRRTF